MMLGALQNVRCICAFPSSASSNHQFRAAPFWVTCLAEPASVPPMTAVLSMDDEEDRRGTNSTAGGETGGDGGDGSGIHVPRLGYISVSKSELLDAIIADKFASQEEDAAYQFLQLSRCLDSIVHAEHKTILEEMRADFDLTIFPNGKGLGNDAFSALKSNYVANRKNSGTRVNSSSNSDDLDNKHVEEADSEMPLSSKFTLNLRQFIGFSLKTIQGNTIKSSRDAIPGPFQQAFMKLLYNAEFEELSHRDLMLTSALNTDYLLTLPISVDWKKASESGTIIFRRGYATERQKGLLIAEKLDYLQSKLLQRLFSLMARPLGRFGLWLKEVFESVTQKEDTEVLANKLKFWFKEFPTSFKSNSSDEENFDGLNGIGIISHELPIRVAAQKAIARYEGILSAIGRPRERLLRKFLMTIGLVPSKHKQACDLDSKRPCSETYLSPSFLPRITLSDIWKPASLVQCGNDFWKMIRTSVSILISESILQEPAFEQLILLYMEEIGERETKKQVDGPSLQMKIYERIPIPDLPVVFPQKKLSFRIVDSVRLDVATILGLLAYFLSYKFEDILSSPSALLLDVIAVSALVIYVFRVLLGYKQTRDRYELLVNRTLYEKTVASGFGCIHFLLDASEQQQFKEAILVYAILLKTEGSQMIALKDVVDKCERFIYDVFQEKVAVPVDKAIETLVRLGLAKCRTVDANILVQAVPCRTAYTTLQKRWNSLIS